jgi:hypothetical protein
MWNIATKVLKNAINMRHRIILQQQRELLPALKSLDVEPILFLIMLSQKTKSVEHTFDP